MFTFFQDFYINNTRRNPSTLQILLFSAPPSVFHLPSFDIPPVAYSFQIICLLLLSQMVSPTTISLDGLAGSTTARLSYTVDHRDEPPFPLAKYIERYGAWPSVYCDDAVCVVLLLLSLTTSSCQYFSSGWRFYFCSSSCWSTLLSAFFVVYAFFRISVLNHIFIRGLSVLEGNGLTEVWSGLFINFSVGLIALVYRLGHRSTFAGYRISCLPVLLCCSVFLEVGIPVKIVYGHFGPSWRLWDDHSFLSFWTFHDATILSSSLSSAPVLESFRKHCSPCSMTYLFR